jgi:YbbR domain-containing protein
MTVLRFLVHNWPLKLLALGLSIILFAGMNILQNTQTWPGTVQIEPVNKPDNSFLVTDLQAVSDIRYIAPVDVRLKADSFSATVDLASVKVGEGEGSVVKVVLQVSDPRVQIVDYRPQLVRVRLDPIKTAAVTVKPTYTTPAGLSPGTPILSSSTVEAKGPASYVDRVAYAEAHVTIDTSGLDVNQSPVLVARDSAGAAVPFVQLDPISVTVQIRVGSQTRTQTVPVHVQTTGNLTEGYYIYGIDVTPTDVTVSGEADALSQLNGMANTKEVSIAGATGDVTRTVGLDLPSGVEALGVTSVKVVVHIQSPSSSRSLTIGVVPEGAKSDRVYVLSIPNVIVTIGGPNAALNALDTSTLVASVEVGSLDYGTHTAAVTVSPPPGIKLLAVSPTEISVTVDHPSTQGPEPSPT